jgi:hypothetical protein
MTGTTAVTWNVGAGPVQIIAQTGPTGDISRTLGPTGATGPPGATGAFQTNYPGTITASRFSATTQLNSPIGDFGTINVGGQDVYLQTLTLINNRSVSSTYLSSSVDGNFRYVHLGAFTAPTGGVVLKLHFVVCAGFNIGDAVTTAGVTNQISQILDLCIYFYTSNAGDKVVLGSAPTQTVLRGFGWCTSTHTAQTPFSVFVTTTGVAATTGSQTYDFYVLCQPFIGSPMVTAATTGLWQADPYGAQASSLARPAGAIKLPVASVNTSMTTVFRTINGGI